LIYDVNNILHISKIKKENRKKYQKVIILSAPLVEHVYRHSSMLIMLK
jgi:hypothetical protein